MGLRGRYEIIYDILNAVQHGPLVKSRLHTAAGLNTHIARNRLDPLVEKGFIEVQEKPGQGRRGHVKFYRITPKGFNLLRRLHEAKQLLEGKI